MMLTLRSIRFCHANNKTLSCDVACMAARPILAEFPNITRTINPYNCTRHRMITYTNLARGPISPPLLIQ
jgi:hypothetical protein